MRPLGRDCNRDGPAAANALTSERSDTNRAIVTDDWFGSFGLHVAEIMLPARSHPVESLAGPSMFYWWTWRVLPPRPKIEFTCVPGAP